MELRVFRSCSWVLEMKEPERLIGRPIIPLATCSPIPAGLNGGLKICLFATSIGATQTGAAIHITNGFFGIVNLTIFDGQYGLQCQGASGYITSLSYSQLDYTFQPVAAVYLGFSGTSPSGSLTISDIRTEAANVVSSNSMQAALYIQGIDTVTVTGGLLAGAQAGIRIDNTNASVVSYNVNLILSNIVVIDNLNFGIEFLGTLSTCSNITLAGMLVQGDYTGSFHVGIVGWNRYRIHERLKC